MTYVPETFQLKGLSIEKAELYGKPHIGAFYEGSGISTNRLTEGARCMVCGRPATNSHHVPPRSRGTFTLSTERGDYELKPSLFALCGSGTTGCHNGFHGGARFFPEWAWNTPEAAESWWTGELLSMFEPHSTLLYAFGHWRVHDRQTGRHFIVCSDDDLFNTYQGVRS